MHGIHSTGQVLIDDLVASVDREREDLRIARERLDIEIRQFQHEKDRVNQVLSDNEQVQGGRVRRGVICRMEDCGRTIFPKLHAEACPFDSLLILVHHVLDTLLMQITMSLIPSPCRSPSMSEDIASPPP